MRSIFVRAVYSECRMSSWYRFRQTRHRVCNVYVRNVRNTCARRLRVGGHRVMSPWYLFPQILFLFTIIVFLYKTNILHNHYLQSNNITNIVLRLLLTTTRYSILFITVQTRRTKTRRWHKNCTRKLREFSQHPADTHRSIN